MKRNWRSRREDIVLVVGRGLLDQPEEEKGLNAWLDALFTSKRKKISLYRIDPEDEQDHLRECEECIPEVVVLTEEQLGQPEIFGLAIGHEHIHAVVRNGQLHCLALDESGQLVFAPQGEGEMVEVPDEEAEEA